MSRSSVSGHVELDLAVGGVGLWDSIPVGISFLLHFSLLFSYLVGSSVSEWLPTADGSDALVRYTVILVAEIRFRFPYIVVFSDIISLSGGTAFDSKQ